MEIKKEGSSTIVTLTEQEAATLYGAVSSLGRGVFSGLTGPERDLFLGINERLIEIKTGKDLSSGRS